MRGETSSHICKTCGIKILHCCWPFDVQTQDTIDVLRSELELALKRARVAEESRDLIQKHANASLEKYRVALELLKDREWDWQEYGPDYCGECDATKEEGHKTGCELASVLK